MEKYRELKKMLNEELEHIQQRGELSAASLAQADTIAHTLKCLATVEAMDKESGYSEHYPPMYPYRGGSYGYGYGEEGGESSYARGRGRNARRDSRGRYSSEEGRSYEDGGESMDGYSSRRY